MSSLNRAHRAVLACLLSLGATTILAAPRIAPPLDVKALNGHPVHLDYSGKVTLVSYWATWCGPCRMEIPDLNRLQSVYGHRGLQIAAVSVDSQGLAVVRPFARRFKLDYPVYVGNAKANNALGSYDGIPTTFLIDSAGRIVRQYTGYQDPRDVQRDIERILPKGSPRRR